MTKARTPSGIIHSSRIKVSIITFALLWCVSHLTLHLCLSSPSDDDGDVLEDDDGDVSKDDDDDDSNDSDDSFEDGDDNLDGSNGYQIDNDGYEIANLDQERKYENEHEDKERCELFDDHELSVCTIRRFEIVKYSFRQDEEYVAVKEDEYEDLTSTSEDACRAYQEIFRMMDNGWMRPTMRFLILVVVCFHLFASSNCFKVVHAIDIKKELVVNKGVVHLSGRRGRGRRSRGLCRGGLKGISRIPAVVIPVIAFGGGHQTHDYPKNNYTSNITRCTSNSTSDSNTACINTGDSVACTT
nr:hypothetical protein [Tanacetum cinerariifolium]